ncbi:MAG: hypothetical protein NWE89_00840 [Candidatus Bathyarchaeota archaeon]|nr:hypothetical protein [Candidatus Bathyarchaeota archaeon]
MSYSPGAKFVVIYNLNLKDEAPIFRAKIVVNVETRELEQFEPVML